MKHPLSGEKLTLTEGVIIPIQSGSGLPNQTNYNIKPGKHSDERSKVGIHIQGHRGGLADVAATQWSLLLDKNPCRFPGISRTGPY